MIKIRATRDHSWGDQIEIRMFDIESHAVVLPVTKEIVGPGTIIEPAFLLGQEEAQSMMDTLWDCGIRPSEGSGSAGAMAATQKHLDDMRSIAFKKLGIEG